MAQDINAITEYFFLTADYMHYGYSIAVKTFRELYRGFHDMHTMVNNMNPLDPNRKNKILKRIIKQIPKTFYY